ncbi:hypothetical protein [Holospora obtusa]|uniref:hypothetical protein n=1 Tax=Holospora obtusa TaxID=49893 RepID=UPI0012EC3090|nr:hypothetical protein [Holospora obtusa]
MSGLNNTQENLSKNLLDMEQNNASEKRIAEFSKIIKNKKAKIQEISNKFDDKKNEILFEMFQEINKAPKISKENVFFLREIHAAWMNGWKFTKTINKVQKFINEIQKNVLQNGTPYYDDEGDGEGDFVVNSRFVAHFNEFFKNSDSLNQLEFMINSFKDPESKMALRFIFNSFKDLIKNNPTYFKHNFFVNYLPRIDANEFEPSKEGTNKY